MGDTGKQGFLRVLQTVAREVYRGLLCLRKIPTDSVPQQDCE